MSKIGSVDWKLTYIWHTLQFSFSSYVRGRNPPSHVTKQATRVASSSPTTALPPVQMLEGSAESWTAFPYGHLSVRVYCTGEDTPREASDLNFSPWKIVNKCVGERAVLLHRGARRMSPSTSWFQCRLSVRKRTVRLGKPNSILLEPKNFSPAFLELFLARLCESSIFSW